MKFLKVEAEQTESQPNHTAESSPSTAASTDDPMLLLCMLPSPLVLCMLLSLLVQGTGHWC